MGMVRTPSPWTDKCDEQLLRRHPWPLSHPLFVRRECDSEFQVAISPYSAIYGAARVSSTRLHGPGAMHSTATHSTSIGILRPARTMRCRRRTAFPGPGFFAAIRAGAGGPIRRNRLWFFLDYEQQLENDPISVINQAFAMTPANLANDFGIPAGTQLPAANGPYPVPGSDTAPDPTNQVYLQQVANTINALIPILGRTQDRRTTWCSRLAWIGRPLHATACF